MCIRDSTETAGLLQRMRVIAVQAANGTWSDAQRAALQLLMDSSLKAVDEVARTTAYNTIHLLDGSRSGLTLQVGSTAGATLAVDLGGAASADGLGLGTAGTTTTTYRTVTTTTPDQTVTTTTPDTYVTTPGPDQVITETCLLYTSGVVEETGITVSATSSGRRACRKVSSPRPCDSMHRSSRSPCRASAASRRWTSRASRSTRAGPSTGC